MKKRRLNHAPIQLIVFIFAVVTACNGQEQSTKSEKQISIGDLQIPDSSNIQSRFLHELLGPLNVDHIYDDPALAIRAHITKIYQDKSGILWFATNGYGVIRYDGDSTVYISRKDGLASDEVRAITEDKNGSVWFGTSGGVTQYDPGDGSNPIWRTYQNFTESDGLVSNDVLSMLTDRQGKIWIGTSNGVSQLDPSTLNGAGSAVFTAFALPEMESPLAVQDIMEDSKGKIWFGTNHGAFIYDPSVGKGQKSVTHISERNGLCDNQVNSIIEDRSGIYWFATADNGVCSYEPSTSQQVEPSQFTHLSTDAGQKGLKSGDLFEDSSGKIWFTIDGLYTYRYDPSPEKGEVSLSNYFKGQECVSHTFETTYEDNHGYLWFGGWLGLYRFEPRVGGQ